MCARARVCVGVCVSVVCVCVRVCVHARVPGEGESRGNDLSFERRCSESGYLVIAGTLVASREGVYVGVSVWMQMCVCGCL